jgi:hypothetical protein
MAAGFSSFVLLLGASVGLAAGTWVVALRLAPLANRPALGRWLRLWTLEGVAVPSLAWAFLNAGLSWTLPPLMPSVQQAAYLGNPWPTFFFVLGAGVFVITSYWAALSVGWRMFRLHAELTGTVRADFRSLLFTSLCGMGLIALGILWLGGAPLLGLAVLAMLAPAGGYAPTLVFPRKMPPIYSRAVAKMKHGKYAEAEWELIHQLEQAEDDYQGWMMMAELYAMHFRDLPEAEQTILEVCDQPSVNKSQMAAALHKLADWHLNLGGDPDAARRALQMIEDRCPGSHLAHMARLRRTQLPATREAWREQRDAAPVPLPALGDSLDHAVGAEPDPNTLAKARETAAALKRRLAAEPENVGLRERLARLHAEQLGCADEAISQVEALLAQPGHPGQKRAEWLSMIAAWEFKYRANTPRSLEILQRIVQDHPETVQAFAARMRLEKFRREPPSAKR